MINLTDLTDGADWRLWLNFPQPPAAKQVAKLPSQSAAYLSLASSVCLFSFLYIFLASLPKYPSAAPQEMEER